jgi:hypothetical protein
MIISYLSIYSYLIEEAKKGTIIGNAKFNMKTYPTGRFAAIPLKWE